MFYSNKLPPVNFNIGIIVTVTVKLLNEISKNEQHMAGMLAAKVY